MKTLLLTLLALTVATLQAQRAPSPLKPGGLATKMLDIDAEPGTPHGPVLKNDSLVKVNVTFQTYAPHIPWQKGSPGGKRGLGVVLSGNRILVTAQMVADATYIELESADGGKKLAAKVIAVDYEANLALLTANALPPRIDAFFAGLKPMSIETVAHAGDTLNVWQIGRVGDLIVTLLKLSKLQVAGYVVDGARFLVYEGQGIVRSEGNSFTVPIVKGGKLAGLLLSYDSKNQLTTVLPGPIIEHFLKDNEDGKYEGMPSLGVEMHGTIDEQFRDYLGLKPDQGGMYVSSVRKGASADAVGLKKQDILLEINGFKIDSRGDYEDPDFGRLNMSHIVRGRSYVGDEVTMKVLRDGKELTLKGKLSHKSVEDNLVLPYLFDRGPNYLVSGGLVFQELTRPYLSAFGQNGGAALARLAWIGDHPEEYEEAGRKHLVFLSIVLPMPSAQGYDRASWNIVTQVNGQKINDLHDLEAALKQPKDGLHVIEFEDGPRKIFMDAIQTERDNLALLGGQYRLGSLKRIE